MKRLIAILLTLSLCVALLPFVNTVEAASYSYNSGQRNSTCTQLTSAAKAYYTGSYTYSTLSGQTSSTLKSNLKTLMTSTHSTLTSYDGLRTLTAYSDTNCSNTSQILLFYTNDSVSSTWDSGSTWNREHIWPQSLGTFTTSNAGSDLHHLRPADPTVNSTRGNKPYGEVSGGTTVKRNATGTIAGTYSSTYYEPNDNVKGDVARILLYVYVRWNETNLTDVIQSTTVLLDWMELDPVDDWEMQRNDIVQSIQGNRNVFIDYPEYAWLIFGQSVPSNLVSPSSGGSSSATATPTTTSGATATPTATSGSGTGTTYNLVTSASSLSAGDTVVIVGVRSAGTVWALGTTQNSNNRAAVQLTDYSSMQSTIEISNDSVAKLTLGGSSGAWTFYDSVNSGYLYAASSSANYLKTQSSASTAANWAISFSSGVASVVSQGSYTRNTMQLNSSSALFSCYSSASQSPVYIYKQAGSTSTATPTPVVTATPTPVVTATPTP
ncbi:MAG TPA: endonuclease, partial [Eubacteriales bacterium]|nr:endonuclease [Eubacteriales bacterium]